VLNKAAEWKADLVALGSHGRSTLERLFLGSVSQKVAAEAVCSVRIARPRKRIHHERLRVAVAVDGSQESLGAVRSVASRIWPEFSEFRVVAVVDPRMETAIGWPDVYAAPWIQARDASAKEAVCRMLEHSAKVLDDAGLGVETHLLSGDPKRELVTHAESWEADNIFLGARGLHHGGRLALGTMASSVAARAHCSVEIVRPG
jgi:nucleotide-binding universal stress UspA family protein